MLLTTVAMPVFSKKNETVSDSSPRLSTYWASHMRTSWLTVGLRVHAFPKLSSLSGSVGGAAPLLCS